MKQYLIMNETDGIFASPDSFDTVKEAEDFIKAFPQRYKHQGYYLTSSRERINPKDVVLKIKEVQQ